jgi:hypothetical protein
MTEEPYFFLFGVNLAIPYPRTRPMKRTKGIRMIWDMEIFQK